MYLKNIGVPDSVCQFYEKAEPSEGIEINDARIFRDVYCINVTFPKYKDYENMNEKEIHSKIIPIASTFKEFLKKFINGELPTDYYELKRKKGR